ncbi:MAG: exodeoxyribonuclease VII large subunit, partial [Bacteroidota bacterium]
HLLVEKIRQQIENDTFQQLNQEKTNLDFYQKQVQLLAQLPIKTARQNLQHLSAQLKLLDPKHILERGYALVQNKNQATVQKAAELKEGEQVKIIFQDGAIQAKINLKENE